MLKRGEALSLAKAFCRAYLERRDPAAVLALMGRDAALLGPGPRERVQGLEALQKQLRLDLEGRPIPFRVRFLEEAETPLGPEAAEADLLLEADNDTFRLTLHVSASAASGPDGTLLRHVHFTAPKALREEGERLPLALVKKRIDAIKRELVEKSMPGGVMGGYIEPGFPFYCINGQMLRYLGYDSEEGFVRDNGGSISNCMHPDDRADVDRAVEEQLAAGTEYTVEYRMRRRDGSYIWVHDVGRAVTAEDGRPAIVSVCVDITGLKETERQLEESRRRYQLAVEGADICVWEYDIPNRRVHQSESAPEYPGYGPVVEDVPEAIIRAGRVREDCVEGVREMYRRLREGEARVGGEFWFCAPGRRSYRCERISYVSVPSPDGKPARAYGVSQDVTRRKEAERRFEEEIRYRERVEAAMLSSCRVNLTAGVVEEQYHEGRIRRNIPYDEVFRKESNHFILEPETAKRIYDEMSSARLIDRFHQGENSLRWEYRIRREKGRRRVQTTVNLMRRPDTGDVLAFFYSKDVTREWLLESTVDTIIGTEYDFIAHIDLRTGLYSVVAHNADTAPAPEEESGVYERMLERMSGRLVAGEAARVREALRLSRLEAELETAQAYTFEYELPDRRGELRRKKLRFTAVDRQTGDVILTQADIEDIVQAEKKKQDALREALRAARDANQAKSDFMARMSHDMRTPMNGVIGLSRLGLDVETLEEARDYFSKIGRSGEYLMLLVNDTLEMNRIESGRLELHPEPLSGQKLFEEVAAINRYAAEEKGITFVTVCDESARRGVLADRERTMQIFNNLLSNAIKFTPRGGRVEFLCSCGGTEDGRCRARVVVRDTGVGIGAEFLPRLFGAFEQENDSTLGEENMGSGLGLSIVKCLVELMGGEIAVESEKGKGTTFQVLLTFAPSELPPEAAPPSGGEAVLSGRRVLLCEDHPLNAQITAKMLEKQGVLVDHAKNGQIGLERFEASHPGFYDAVLMDVRMPVLDGLEATRRIRALPREDAKTVPILAMTANAFQEDREKSRLAGMDGHLSKPVAPQELYAALRKWISG